MAGEVRLSTLCAETDMAGVEYYISRLLLKVHFEVPWSWLRKNCFSISYSLGLNERL